MLKLLCWINIYIYICLDFRPPCSYRLLSCFWNPFTRELSVGTNYDNINSAAQRKFILTYLGPWLLLGHRPSTTSLQRLLSWAILSRCCQLSPICVMSASRSRRQVFFGIPPSFSCPDGSTSRPVLYYTVLLSGFLEVWP